MNRPRPQRISPVSPPGALLKRVDVQPRLRRFEQGEGREPSYLAMVRQLPCLKCGMEPSEAAHVRFASAAFGKASGLGKKPDDRHSVPLCAGCHRLDRDAQHTRNEREFWDSIGINPLLIAERLYAQRGDLAAMCAVVIRAISERCAGGRT
ncbi:MAG TPA: hypothetical protein VF499_02990 [Afipia sp.]